MSKVMILRVSCVRFFGGIQEEFNKGEVLQL